MEGQDELLRQLFQSMAVVKQGTEKRPTVAKQLHQRLDMVLKELARLDKTIASANGRKDELQSALDHLNAVTETCALASDPLPNKSVHHPRRRSKSREARPRCVCFSVPDQVLPAACGQTDEEKLFPLFGP